MQIHDFKEKSSSVLLLYSVSSTKSKNEEIRDKVSKFIYYQMTQCKINQEKCKIEQFFDTKVTQVSASWFVFSGWRNEDQEPMGWQGAMFYHHQEHQEHAEDELLSGYYIYPDWTSCIEGLWQFHQLLEGHQCTIEDINYIDEHQLEISKTRRTNEEILSYSPPTFYSFGVPPLLPDPFERNTITVKGSNIEGANEGLFVKRNIKKGELISFYSGYLNTCAALLDHLLMDRRVGRSINRLNQNALAVYDTLQPEKTFHKLCITVPLEFSSLDKYQGTLGHKANHSPDPNAKITLYSTHPVLGTVMCLVALEDISSGEEVLCNYGYNEDVYQELNIASSPSCAAPE